MDTRTPIWLVCTVACLLTARCLCAAELVVEKAENFHQSEFQRLELWTLFEPTTAIHPTFAGDGRTATFADLAPGKYSLVCWQGLTTWQESPVYDAMVEVEEKDQHLKHRVAAAGTLTKLQIETTEDLMTMYEGCTYVPCRIQRLEPPFAPAFAFRWVPLTKLGGGRFEGEAMLVPGRYVLVIPYPAASEAFPFPARRRRPFEGYVPLLAMPFNVSSESTASDKQTSGLAVKLSPPVKAGAVKN